MLRLPRAAIAEAPLASRGETAWHEVETERRSAIDYERASALLADLRALAERDGAVPTLDHRLMP